MHAIRQTVIQFLLGLMIFILDPVGTHAQTPLVDGIWISTDKNFKAVLIENGLLVFEGTYYSGGGKLRPVTGGWQAKMNNGKVEYDARMDLKDDRMETVLNGRTYKFNFLAPRDRSVEQQMSGQWHVSGDPDTRVLIEGNTMRWVNTRDDRASQMTFAVFGQYWLNIQEEGSHDPDPIALFDFVRENNTLAFAQDGTTLFTLSRVVVPDKPGEIDDTETHTPALPERQTITNAEYTKRITRFQEQENSLIGELDQNNTKAKRDMLAWVRHDRATALFERYNTSQDEDDMDAALAYAESATELSPDTSRFWKTFGFINLASKRGMIADIQAEGSFKRILEIDPKDTDARSVYIGILLENGEYKKAAEHYAILFKQKPEAVIAADLHRMNLAFISAGVAGWGVEVYDAYLDKNPHDAKVMIAKSILLRADDETSAMAQRILNDVINASDTPENIKQTAKNIENYWTEVEMFGDLGVEP